MLACHLKGIKDGVHYEYRETMPYKREPEFIEVSPKDHGMIQKPVCFFEQLLFFPGNFVCAILRWNICSIRNNIY